MLRRRLENWVGHEIDSVRIDWIWIFIDYLGWSTKLFAKFVVYLQPILAVTLWPVPNLFLPAFTCPSTEMKCCHTERRMYTYDRLKAWHTCLCLATLDEHFYGYCTRKAIKGNLQQKCNSSHLKEIQKQCLYIVYTIIKFLYLFYFGRYSHRNQRTVRHLGLIFNSLTMFRWRHKRDKPFKATPKYLPTIKYCLKPFQPVLKSVRAVVSAY